MAMVEKHQEKAALDRVSMYPLMRYMGSKHKLVPWIHDIACQYEFDSVLDGFSGSGVVSYMFKSMGKRVYSNDFLNFSSLITKGLVENSSAKLTDGDVELLIDESVKADNFISTTFKGVFYTPSELKFLDKVSANIQRLHLKNKRALAYTALFRACLKKQPRGVFTVSGNLDRYNDGRRDLRLSIKQHFIEQIALYNSLVFDNGQENRSFNQSIFEFDNKLYKPDLVYFDPPYVPKSDDNCYIKRYHFLEGLSKYWAGEKIMEETKVKKIEKKYTPFSYRRTSLDAFNDLFKKFSKSTIFLSYSSNAFPELDTLISIMKQHKKRVAVYEKPHRYHFGNHANVKRSEAKEYLIVGVD